MKMPVASVWVEEAMEGRVCPEVARVACLQTPPAPTLNLTKTQAASQLKGAEVVLQELSQVRLKLTRTVWVEVLRLVREMAETVMLLARQSGKIYVSSRRQREDMMTAFFINSK